MGREIQDVLRAQNPLDSDTLALACLEVTQVIPLVSSADASTAVAPTTDYAIDQSCDLVGVTLAAAASVANDASNYATYTLKKYTTAGTVSTTVATIATSTSSHSISAHVGHSFDLVTSQCRLNQGETLVLLVAKAGDGVSTGSGNVRVRTRRRGVV